MVRFGSQRRLLTVSARIHIYNALSLRIIAGKVKLHFVLICLVYGCKYTQHCNMNVHSLVLR